jgi:two-component system, NarL family, sensor kinase
MQSLKLVFRFVLLASLLTLTQCKENKPTIYKMADKIPVDYENKWLADPENFDNEVYKDSFDTYFQQAIKAEDFEKASKTLLSVCDIMNNRGFYSPHYVEVLEKYIASHQPQIFTDYLFSMYVTLGVAKTFSGSYEEAIRTLEKLTQIEPNNYSTVFDLSFAYYYISCNYHYLGDYVKSLEELNKGIEYMNQTDDLGGQLFLEQRRTYVLFTTKNNEDALESVEKSLKLYKNIDDKEGEAMAMLSKHDHLSGLDKERADAYIDTLTAFMTKHKISSNHNLLGYQLILIKKSIIDKDLETLHKLVPQYRTLTQKANIKHWNQSLLSVEGRYDVIQNKPLSQKKELLELLDIHRKNEDYYRTRDILLILKDDAVNQENFADLLQYDNELENLEKEIQEDELQLKVKTFEKKIDVEKKEKIIAQQSNKLASSYNYIMLLVVVVFSIVVFVTIFSLRRKRKQALDEQIKQEQFTFQLLQNTEEERNRIANELHDSVNHDLLNIKNKLANNKNVTDREVEHVIEEVRNISRNLYPAVLQNLGLEASIESLCERLSEESALFTTCEIDYQKQLRPSQELQLYRIIQEALNNTLKHGKANAAKVLLNSDGRYLHLEIKDNGSGFDFAEKVKSKTSFGLQSILQRAKAIAAKIDIRSNQFGTVITLKIPT